MKTYIGTKRVKLMPMNRQEYNDYRGWTLPEGEDGSDEGYLVEYTDGGKPNDPRHEGYISWSPKAQADAAYRPTDGLSFGLAIEAMRMGRRVTRPGWNGKDMWLTLQRPDEQSRSSLAFISLRTASGDRLPWVASHTDMLADDWRVLES